MNNALQNELLWSPDISPDTEPRQIAIARGEWFDASRENRKVAYKTYCPVIQNAAENAATFPTIIWSHGLGGSREGAGFISRFIASHGYIIVHIQHHGTDSSLWEGKDGHPWDVIRSTHIPRRATLQRFQDVPFALSQLDTLDIAPLIDRSKMGMSGHSFGGMTTQIMAGQRRGYGARRYSLHQPEFKAGIVYSPSPVQNYKNQHPENYYGGIKIPLLMMTGTDDDSPLENFGYKERLDVFTHSGGPDQHLLILDKGDHMVYNGSRGQLKENPKRDIHEEIIKILSLAFWEAYLKGDEKAKKWLTGNGVTSWLSDEGTYSYRP